MKKKTKVLLLLSCALVLVVGGVAAVALRQQPAAPPGPEPTPRKIGEVRIVTIKVMHGINAVYTSCGLPLGLAWVEAPERTSTEGVSLSFTGLDVDETEGTVTLNLLLENEQRAGGTLSIALNAGMPYREQLVPAWGMYMNPAQHRLHWKFPKRPSRIEDSIEWYWGLRPTVHLR